MERKKKKKNQRKKREEKKINVSRVFALNISPFLIGEPRKGSESLNNTVKLLERIALQ